MNLYFRLLLLLITAIPAAAQLPHGTGNLVTGTYSAEWTTETIRFDDADRTIPNERTVTTTRASTSLLMSIVDRNADERMKFIAGMIARGDNVTWLFMHGTNHTRTRTADEPPIGGEGAPTSPVTYSVAYTRYGLDPCTPRQGQLVEVERSTWAQTSDATVVRVIVKLSKSLDGYLFCTASGGVSRQSLPVPAENLTADYSDGCRTKWVPRTSKTSPANWSFPTNSCDDVLHVEVPESDVQSWHRTDIDPAMVRVDALNAWMTNPKPVTFTMPFSRTHTESMMTTTVRGTITVTFGETDRRVRILAGDRAAYEDWMPVAESDPAYRPLRVRVRSEEKGAPRKASMQIVLSGVSRHPGVATNFPVTDAPDVRGDLYFPASEHNRRYFDVLNDTLVVTKNEESEVEVEIAARDYAASGLLIARAADGVQATSDYDDGPYLQLPLDVDRNGIADAWQKQMGAERAEATADDDALPAGQRRNGDGFTLFEEYRGFMAVAHVPGRADAQRTTKGHVRTNPGHKDVFLLDEAQKFMTYYAPVNPAELTWHLVDRTQMRVYDITYDANNKPSERPGNRQINVNTPADKRLGVQQGHHLVIRSTKYRGDSDLTTAGAAEADEPFSVANAKYVWMQEEEAFKRYIVDGFMRDPALSSRYSRDQAMQVAQNQYENTVIHELGHALGIRHHCRGHYSLREKNANGDSVVVIERLDCSHRLHSEQAHRILAGGGVASCAMTYTLVDDRETRVGRVLNRQITYCRKGDIYLDEYMAKQPADDCFGQIDVKGMR